MRAFRNTFQQLRLVIWTGLTLLAADMAAHGSEGWHEAACDLRLPLTIRGDLRGRDKCDAEIILNFNALLGVERTLAASSLRLREAKTSREAPLDLAEDPQVRYPSGNPSLRLRWNAGEIPAFGDKHWYLYLQSVPPGDPKAWRTLPQTFKVGPSANVLLQASFEQGRADKPGLPEVFQPWGEDKEGFKTERIWTEETERTGKKSLKVSRVTQPGAAPYGNLPFWYGWPPLEVKEGDSYRISIWVKTKRLVGDAYSLVFMHIFDENQRQIGHYGFGGPRWVSDWTEATGGLVMPPGARSIALSLQLVGDGEVFFDDLTISRMPRSDGPVALDVWTGIMEERDDAIAGQDEKLLQCGLVKQPPKLDGVLDDPCWAEAGRISDFFTFMRAGGASIERPTTVLGCADTDAIYFAFECMEPALADDPPVVTADTGRDSAIWDDDSMEIFLDTNRDQKSFYQIVVNSKGTLFDQDIGIPGLPGVSWDGPIDAAAKVGKDRWTAEVRIGFVGLRLAEAAGRVWTGNFCRTSRREGGTIRYTWVDVKYAFGEPKIFGKIILPLDPTANAVTAKPLVLDTVFFGEGNLPIAVTSRRSNPVQAQLSVTAIDGQESRRAGKVAFTIQPGATTKVAVPCSFPKTGTTNLKFELHELPAERLLSVTSGKYSVREPLEFNVTSSVLYISEETLAGTWKVGISEALLKDSKIILSVISAGKSATTDKPTPVAQQIVPQRADGSFALDISKLPAGSYVLRVELVLGAKTIAGKDLAISRISGPFYKANGHI